MARFFVQRPILAVVVSIVTLILGMLALALLPVSLFPNVTPPEIMVSTSYPGADAVTVERAVATLIPLLAVPVSLIGAFIFFPLLGFSINTLSLFGLVLAIGLVVDDAIVVVEAVERHLEAGLAPKEATLQAMKEITGPVIGVALVLASVFVPTAFIPGITGRLYQQFAVTIAVSVLISAFNALTLSPALCALLLRPRRNKSGPLSRFFAGFNYLFGRATDGYIRLSAFLIRRTAIALLLLAAFAAAAFFFGKNLPTSFLPTKTKAFSM
jgi:hydrophobic/amphiphilic exporter-1 (mainly G- bacteria), HAE1 family